MLSRFMTILIDKNKYRSIVVILFLFGVFITGMLMRMVTERVSTTQFQIAISSLNKQSKWPRNTLVVVPAIWKEIDWKNRTSWPEWLRIGLGLSYANPRSYYVHLYQRVDPNSKYPYDWSYSINIREETGIYLQFIHDYYYDLPDKILFMHGNPLVHTAFNPIQTAQCIRDDVHFASVNDNREFIRSRPWNYWPRDPDDNISLMYKCVKRFLRTLGFDAEKQLNPLNKTPKDESVMSGFCCAQFYVTKQRIQRYTYAQWEHLFNARLEPFCTTARENGKLGDGIQWYGGAFEHMWHIILGLYPTDSPVLEPKTTTDRCQWFRKGCSGSPCA